MLEMHGCVLIFGGTDGGFTEFCGGTNVVLRSSSEVRGDLGKSFGRYGSHGKETVEARVYVIIGSPVQRRRRIWY